VKYALLLAAVTAAAHVARAQDSTALGATDRATAMRLQQIVDRARADGLPVQPIVAKVRYASLVVHAPTPKVIAAAEAVAERLALARQALAPRASDGEIDNAADALGLGVPVSALEALRAASPNKPIAVPIGVLTQLVASRVPIAKATAIVKDLIKRGASDEQLVALGNNVNEDVALGRKPDAAAEIRANGLIPLLAPSGANANAAAAGPTSASPVPRKP